MHDNYTKMIRRRIEDYLRKADKKKIMALAIILKINMEPKTISSEELLDE